MNGDINGDYYLGLDIGTDSVGWAVTDEEYNICKYRGKSMWGVRLFDGAKTAAERRQKRAERRRRQRKVQRIKLLQEIFAEEICKVDTGFFQRLKDSQLYVEDKEEKQPYALFADKDYNDRMYHKEYPTIYHLRKELLDNPGVHDVRLVYLALHHIIKHRGHFLIDGNLENATDFEKIFTQFIYCLNDELDIDDNFDFVSVGAVKELMKDKNMSNDSKKKELIKLFQIDKKNKKMKTVLSLIAGLSGNLTDLFDDIDLEKSEGKICFSEWNDDILEKLDENKRYFIGKIKTVYNWGLLNEIIGDENYLCYKKVKDYDKHKEDLKKLRYIVKKYAHDSYKDLFNTAPDSKKGIKDNYCSYVGSLKKNGKKKNIKRSSSKEDFLKYVKMIIDKIDINKVEETDSEILKYIKDEISMGNLMPLQVSNDNSIIPYQIHGNELKKILENASGYIDFLNVEDDDGFTAKDKIEKIFSFRIPYYVGPLNDFHKDKGANCWIVRKESGIIRPWNFEQKVDVDSSAEEFIKRMTNKCTYLVGEDVLPKCSLLYSEYEVLNELNNLKINDEKIPNELKTKIFENLFKKHNKVTIKKLIDYLVSEGYEDVKEGNISGIDNGFKSSMSSYLDFKKKVFKNQPDKVDEYSVRKMIEDIIRLITLYPDDTKILERSVRRRYRSILSDEQIKEICKLQYSGWGRLSEKFLTGMIGVDRDTGYEYSIIEAMRKTDNNLMQILSKKFTFSENIDKENSEFQEKDDITYENLVQNLYVSPAVKRSIWQTILILEEIRKIMGREPKKIFLEMARNNGEKKRTQSKKDKLIDLYKNCKDESRDWIREINDIPENRFSVKKLYLYYLQMGKCMYTGEKIDLDQLFNNNMYDLDHIYPRSKVKDDSLDNLVLVKRETNEDKKDGPVKPEVQRKMWSYWKSLKDKGFISEEKYTRLKRSEDFTADELAGFVNRQLVETRQSSKASAELLKRIYKNSNVVYVKGETVADFRHEKLKCVKVRSLNDFHHAKDAYLNIVVGNVYDCKFTNNPVKWLESGGKYNLENLFDKDIFSRNKRIWNGFDSVSKILKIVKKNNILCTRYSLCNKGELFDQEMKRKDENPTIPIKKGLDVEKYGGYKSENPAYFMLIKYEKNGKLLRRIEPMPLYIDKIIDGSTEEMKKYCEEGLKLQNPDILMKIKKDAHMIIDGFPMYLRGSSGDQLKFQGAVQLCMDDEFVKYLKKVEKYIEQKSRNKDIKVDEYSGITSEENLKLYDEFLRKHKETIYKKRPAGQIANLEKWRNSFEKLAIEEQCYILNEILHLFQCKPLLSDLRYIGGGKTLGNMTKKKEISLYKEAIIVHQSVTGLFRQDIDLLKI